jgi:hypothetical protein
MREVAREVALCPTPNVRGLRARYFVEESRAFRGRYLFECEADIRKFSAAPSVDPAFAKVKAHVSDSFDQETQSFEIAQGIFDRPVFIISAPRAGSTVLYDLLARCAEFWTTGRESEGPIEGIPALHVANRSFNSHRLTDVDADALTTETLRAAMLAEVMDSEGRRYLDRAPDERPNQIRLLEKTPENALRVSFLAAAFPAARFIFLHRDARQNVSSILSAWRHPGFVKIPFLPGWERTSWSFILPEGWRRLNHVPLLDIAAFQWSNANHTALDDLESIPREQWMSVDYAELIATPEAVARRICQFADVKIDPSFAAILKSPLPVSSTTITFPSPIKWRSNREFNDSALRPFTPLMARIRDLDHRAPPPRHSWRTGPVHYECFLSDSKNQTIARRERWVVNPSFLLQLGTVPLELLQRTRFRDCFLDGYPVAWIEDAPTKVVYPFWVQRRDAYLFRRFEAGRQPPALPDGLAAQLFYAGILIDPEKTDERLAGMDDLVRRAGLHFVEHRYCELPLILHPAHIRALSCYYTRLIEAGQWTLGDPQVRFRFGQHNEAVSRYFHHQLTDLISRVAGEPVKPSYSYVSAYREGAILRAHVDRKQCEFTLSLALEDNLQSDSTSWPLWFQSDRGKVALNQAAGDAVLFRGCELPHWRDKSPPGHSSTMLLFHYVSRDFREVLD